MNGAKIQLSAEELELVQNAAWVLTKNKIMHTVVELFGSLSAHMQSSLQAASLPPAVLQTTPKISKGENYKGLPYVMLDYPRLFTREAVFAVRSFFWWGNYFSITLHLKGVYKELFSEHLLNQHSLLAAHDFYISIAASEWEHEIDTLHYKPLKGMDTETISLLMSQQPFLKIATKMPLDRWGESELLLEKRWQTILEATGSF